MANQLLSGKSALVTGGARRIGREIALALAESGADVAITYRTSRGEALETVREIQFFGSRALAVKCDVRSERQVRRAVEAVANGFGRLDLLVNNAAVLSLRRWSG